MNTKANPKKLSVDIRATNKPRKSSPSRLTPSPTTHVNGTSPPVTNGNADNGAANTKRRSADLSPIIVSSRSPVIINPSTPADGISADNCSIISTSTCGEERRLVRRSSVICSSFRDKYTFDSEQAGHNSSRTVNFKLDNKHAEKKHSGNHQDKKHHGSTSVLKDASPSIPPPSPATTLSPNSTAMSSESVVKRNSLVHPGREDLPKSICISGRFQNPWPTWRPPSFTNILKFGLSKDNSNIPQKQELDLVLPVVKPDFKPQTVNNGVKVTWLGHATVLVQMHGLNILTDPIFSERASPSQMVGPKRYRDTPCTVHELPPIHAVVISHNHYDHLDLNSVVLLNARFGADLRWFVPLGLQDWMNRAGCDNVLAMDWWEENCVPDFSDVSFVFTASQHWCKRTLGDDNKVLWGGWAIIGPRYKFYYTGDTGYCEVFKQIGQAYGPFDVCAIPIGAYEPRWFMKYQHIDPSESVKIHEDVQSRFSVAVHWGTFALANEYYLDPPMKLRSALEERQIPVESFITLKHGESKLIGSTEDETPNRSSRRASSRVESGHE